MKQRKFSLKKLWTISVLFLSVLPITTLAQNDPTKEILVYFTSGVERAAKGQLTARTASSAAKTILAHFKIGEDKITSAFPDFDETDTLKKTPEGRTIGMPNMAKIFRIRVPDGVVRKSVIDSLKKLSNVLFAEPNGIAAPHSIPDDQYFSYQYSLQAGGGTGKISAPEAWDIYTGSSSSIIGIIDYGVDGTHPDLSGKVSGDAPNTVYHGTHVAGIAAAKTNNNATGISGVDWNAQLLSKNIEYSDDVTTYQQIVDAVNYSSNVNVLNNSWGLIYPDHSGGRYSTTVKLAFVYAYKMNRTAVVAMGNSNGSQTQYPAGFGQGIIAIGSTDADDVVAGSSNIGNHIDVTAPGVSILSTYRNGNFSDDANYHTDGGTSMAAPHVSGIASLLKGYNSNLYNDDIENIIRLSADKVEGMNGQDFTTEYGYGRVNARKALNLLRAPVALTQATAYGGTDYYKGPATQMAIYGVSGLPTAVYIVYRHEVRKNVTFPTSSFRKIWGRGAATFGWADNGNVNFGMGWCEAVPGTVTSSSATLRTNVYEVYNTSGQWIGWYPTTPGNVTFAYSVLGVPQIISTNSTLDGNFAFDDYVTVNSGATLTITPGSVISFASGKSLIVQGVLNANGTSSQPITFTSQSGTTPGSWEGITFYESGASGSTLNHVKVQYGNDIYAINVPSFTVNNSTIENMVNGVNAYGSNGWVMNSTITNPRDHGIVSNISTLSCYHNTITKTDFSGAGILYTAGASDYIWDNDISGFNWGIGAIWGSSAYCGHPSNTGNNNSITNCLIGANVYQSGYAMFGEYIEYDDIYNPYYAGNTIDNNISYDAQVYTNSTVFAQGTNWGGGSPTYSVYDNSIFYYDLGGNNRVLANGKLNMVEEAATFGNEQSQQNSISLKTLSSTSVMSKDDLGILPYIKLMKTYNDTTAESILNTFLSLDEKAPQVTKLLLANIYLKRDEIEKAKQVNSDLSKANPNSALGCRAELNNFYIALYKERNINVASAMLDEIAVNAKYIEPIELALAMHDLKTSKVVNESMGNSSFKKHTEQINAISPDKFELLQNYPNPFNPTTTIAFSLPQEGNVTLKVFDALGREVAILVNSFKSAGHYNVEFNALAFASGVYFYRLQAGSNIATKKLVLMK
ncbi:MAG: S8 family serine peptidase [Bacteroidota bacterium]|nr:S8 family serine peptidase [Bacteroidota bacterium]